MKKEYLEKIYSSFLGMNIGIRLGAPVEGGFWTEENIQKYYGDVRGYLKYYRHFAADDDANGPVFFLRALDDKQPFGDPTPQDVAEAWLNYAREGTGVYWWGGYGISTEHTAYLNLKNGIPAPQSGSIEQNGIVVAEQIGGQIFIDTWGMICPGDPVRAARYARTAASVSHDGEGLNGAAFIAAAIAAAFDTSDVQEIIREGLKQIPKDSTYRKVFDAVIEYYVKAPDDWRGCLHMLQHEWGYDKYPGNCHIIPNAGVCALALCYGKGDFARTIEIATMCSWDTDCNAGNVGSILGAAVGIAGIPDHYRAPINDCIVLSGISGYLNVLDIPTYARKLASLGDRLAGQKPDPAPCENGETHFDFSLPGSTHGFEVSNAYRFTGGHGDDWGGAFKCFFENVSNGQECHIGYRTFYRRRDFSDERYSPVFSPLAYPGQKAEFTVRLELLHGDNLSVIPYARETYSGQEYQGKSVILTPSDGETVIRYTLPDVQGGLIEEIGLRVTSLAATSNYNSGTLYLTDFRIHGRAAYEIDLTKSVREFSSVLPFSHNHGSWTLHDGRMEAMSLGHAEAVTGNYYSINVRAEAEVTPLHGDSHLLGVRVQGAQRGVYGGLAKDGNKPVLVIGKTVNGKWQTLATKAFDWKTDKPVRLSMEAKGRSFTLTADGSATLEAHDENANAYGMVGFAQYAAGRTAFGNLKVEELA